MLVTLNGKYNNAKFTINAETEEYNFNEQITFLEAKT